MNGEDQLAEPHSLISPNPNYQSPLFTTDRIPSTIRHIPLSLPKIQTINTVTTITKMTDFLEEDQ